MKKLITIGLILAAILVMVGCGSEENISAEDLNKSVVNKLDKEDGWSYTILESDENTLSVTKEMLSSGDTELTSLKSETVYAISTESEIKVLTIIEITDEKERKEYKEFISGENSEYYVSSKGNFIITAVEENGDDLVSIVKEICK